MRALLVASVAVACALAVPCLTSCSDDETTTFFTVWAFEEPLGPGLDGEAADKPLAGAQIAFDPPGGGSRVLLNAAPDGHATFEGDFTLGDGAVTIFDRAHVLASVIEVSPEAARARPNAMGKPAEDLVVLVPALDDVLVARTVEVRGALTGKRDATTSIDLSASGVARLGSTETTGATYAVRAPRGRPFFILGHETKNVASEPSNVTNELVGSFRVDIPAFDGDYTVHDVDVETATRLASRSVHLRAVLPTAAGSPFGVGTRSSAIVVSADSRLLLAPIESARASSDGRSFELAMAVAETDIAPEHPLTRASLVATDGSRSVRVEPGVVTEGKTFDDFLAPPRIVAGVSPTGLNEPIVVEEFPAGAELAIEIFAGPQLAWVITAPARDAAHARDPIHVPVPLEIRLPALVAASFSARTDRVALAPGSEVFRRVSFSRDVLFRR